MRVSCPDSGPLHPASATENDPSEKSRVLANRRRDLTLERLAYSVAEAAVVTGLSRSKLYELIQSRELASLKIGGRRLLRRESLVALLDTGGD